ncbi:hypothetical protein VTJ49DRAFT_117 [Mycothermus thermophilus]|uniref:Dipeptidyl-peptidase V n=1 Tax=Humicola insolens TaxID=85995 RepID=A0ABR3VRH6_HUMIN
MTVTATKFTPEVMLSAPRRSPGVPNPSGKLVLYTIRVLDIESGNSELLTEDPEAGCPVWVGEEKVLYLKTDSRGNTTFIVRSVKSPEPESYDIGKINAPLSDLKVKKLPSGNIALACSALVNPDGELVNPETDKKPLSSAKVYTSLFVRHWDTWNSDRKRSIFYGALGEEDGKLVLLGNTLTNALGGTNLSSPVPPFGDSADFDIGPSGLVFVAKDPELDPATYTKTDLYFIPLKTFTEPQAPAPRIIKTPGLEGYSQTPVFSHCGTKVAFTRMHSRQYESDKTRLILVPDINNPDVTEEFYATEDGAGGWDSRPEAIAWGLDDSHLYVSAEFHGRRMLFQLPSTPSKATQFPKLIETPKGSVVGFSVLHRPGSETTVTTADILFVSSTSLIDNSCYSIAHPGTLECRLISSTSKEGKSFGLSRSQVDSIWFSGAGDYDVHAWVVRPSTFSKDSKKKYPLAMLIHGGPQGAWNDSWSTRWNPAVFAEQGYVVVCPNPTGSTGYGQDFEDAITGNWGGRPYQDLVRCFEWIEQNMPEVDTDRAVALGASYGGFMINWIQGQPLGRKFKALVCHDGVFSTLNQWATEELFFPIHDFEGTLYENRAAYEKWDPARFANEWATPELIIHSELDYRLPVTEGLAAFNVLQAKKVPSKLLVFPDENHWVLKPENSLVWHREVLGWINKYSGVEEEQKSN